AEGGERLRRHALRANDELDVAPELRTERLALVESLDEPLPHLETHAGELRTCALSLRLRLGDRPLVPVEDRQRQREAHRWKKAVLGSGRIMELYADAQRGPCEDAPALTQERELGGLHVRFGGGDARRRQRRGERRGRRGHGVGG